MGPRLRLNLLSVVLLALLLSTLGAPAEAQIFDVSPTPRPEASAYVEPGLRETLQAEGRATYLVRFEESADLSAAYDIADWEARGWYVYTTLLDVATRSQAGVLELLKTHADVVAYTPHFIVNGIHVTSGMQTLDAIATRPNVVRIEAEKVFSIPEPVVEHNVLAAEWGVDMIRAPEVWDMGILGAGVVVATVDTGAQYDHPALASQYRGALTGSDDFSFYDPANVCGGAVCDNHGHGTHVIGSILGDDGGTNQIGVAPAATWIAAKGCETSSCSQASLLSSAEWLLAPCEFGAAPGTGSCDTAMRPHVINNSWGGGSGQTWFQDSVDAWRAAAIVPVFSAGNSGPGAGTVGSPGDSCNVIGVGATNSSDDICTFSSRGPGAFLDCSAKPDVSAPGQAVRSSEPGSRYATRSGTSMAAPRVAGCIGLMLSAAPGLPYDLIHHSLTTTAVDLGAPGFDYDYGYGRIDCYEAAREVLLLTGATGSLVGVVTAAGSGDPLAGVEIEATLGLTITRSVATGAAGNYEIPFATVGAYTMTAGLYGYLPQTVSGVEVVSGTVTTQDFVLDEAPSYEVSGVATDDTTGWPLYASIQIDGAPLTPIWTDPVDGSYSIRLPAGHGYTLHVQAWVRGYDSASRVVGPLSGDQTENFGLQADLESCSAPGYRTRFYYEGFQDDDGGYTLSGDWPAPWQWGTPTPWPQGCVDGATCWGTNLTGGYAYYANETLTSPVIDLTGVPPGTSLFVHWYQANDIVSSPHAEAFAEVSIAGGPWRVMWQHSTWEIQSWHELSYDISDAAGLTVQLRWRFISDYRRVYSGWYVDRVTVRTVECVPAPGGLLVGQVYDGNTAAALTRALVTGGDDSMVTVATPADAAVDDAFYTIFVGAGSQTVTASRAGGYADETATVQIAAGTSTEQDFSLDAGWLSVDPPALELAVKFGAGTTAGLTLHNQGHVPLEYTLLFAGLSEDFEGSFPPAGWTVVNHGGDCVWQRNDAWPRDNYAGGEGFAAVADSRHCGSGTKMDTELRSPVLDLSGASVATLDFVAAYARCTDSNSATFRVHASGDGGDSWDTLLTWTDVVHPTGPGMPVSLDLSAYLGSNQVIVSFHYDAPGWDWWAQVDQVRVLTNVGPWLALEPATGYIDGQDTAMVDVVIDTSSLPAPGTYTALIQVRDDTPYGVVAIPVTLSAHIYGVTLTPPAQALVGFPGEGMAYTLTVTNTGGATDEFDFSAVGHAWDVTLPAPVTLAAGAATDVTVWVEVPADAAGGATDVAVVRVSSAGDPDANATAELTTTAATVYGVTLAPSTAAQTALPGEVVTYTLYLTNTGNVTDSFDFTAAGYVWAVDLPGTVTLVAGETWEISIVVEVPAGSDAGDEDVMTVTARSVGDAERYAQSTLTTRAVTPGLIRIYLPLVVNGGAGAAGQRSR